MHIQQIIAFFMVGMAACYVGRSLIRSGRDLFSAKSGCGGCGKCAFAKDTTSVKTNRSTEGQTIIPLTDIRSLPSKVSKQ